MSVPVPFYPALSFGLNSFFGVSVPEDGRPQVNLGLLRPVCHGGRRHHRRIVSRGYREKKRRRNLSRHIIGEERRIPISARPASASLGDLYCPLQIGLRVPHLILLFVHLFQTSTPFNSGGSSVDPPE